ncbi:MAG: hypothetical protein BRD23_05310 [Halobacteriales archaeon SW_9_67_25]|nr:MAG: hypothetical protein BRD23_05310 [Halobacteriales archaeon SW_9_67_25]
MGTAKNAVGQIPAGALADRYGPRYVGAGGAAVLSLGAIGFTEFGYRVAFGVTTVAVAVAFLSALALYLRRRPEVPGAGETPV